MQQSYQEDQERYQIRRDGYPENNQYEYQNRFPHIPLTSSVRLRLLLQPVDSRTEIRRHRLTEILEVASRLANIDCERNRCRYVVVDASEEHDACISATR